MPSLRRADDESSRLIDTVFDSLQQFHRAGAVDKYGVVFRLIRNV